MKKGSENTRKPMSLRKKLIAICAPSVAVIVAVVILFTNSGVVEAAVSLPHIAIILDNMRNGSGFNILEIVEDPDDAEFGYMIEGKEPGDAGDFEANLSQYGPGPGVGSREEYATNVTLNNLINSGIMGPSGSGVDDNILTEIASYQEAYPWKDTTGLRRLQLRDFDPTVSVTGIRTPVDGIGAYKAKYDYVPEDDIDLTAQYRLIIEKLIYMENDSDPGYSSDDYHILRGSVEFLELKFDNVIGNFYDDSGSINDDPTEPYFFPTDAPIYTLNTGGGAGGADIYVYFGTIAGGANFDDAIIYYTVLDYGNVQTGLVTDFYTVFKEPTDAYAFVPSAPVSTNTPPYADGDIPRGARFARDIEYLTYVERGGDYDFTEDSTNTSGVAESTEIRTDIIYYTGGFVNNNWFLRHIFDVDDGDQDMSSYAARIDVNVVTASNLNEADINIANLIILNGNLTSLPANSDRILERAINDETPVMFYKNLDTQPALTAFVQNLASKQMTGGIAIGIDNGVNENIFWTTFSLTELLDEIFPWNSPSALLAVKTEIEDENFLRNQQGIPPLNKTGNLCSAAAIRYIINFSGRRPTNKWDEINVLEIQGGIPLDYRTSHNTPSYSETESDLTVEKIRQYIGDTDEEIKINLVRMTTYEFIGKIEDLNDNYHLIYIGGTARGMNDSGGESRYNDSAMNGLVYTNIGDLYYVNNNNGEGTALRNNIAGDTNTGPYRLSGNDISPQKMRDIIDFARAGYPVLIDDRLISGDVSISVTASGNAFTFSASASGYSSVSYRWYRVNNNVQSTTISNAATFQVQSNGSNFPNQSNFEYYCEITVGGETVTVGPVIVQRLPSAATTIIHGGPVFGTLSGSTLNINTQRVDNSSYVYEALETIIPFDNVYSFSKALSNPAAVNRYLNLSKPELEPLDVPVPYSMDSEGNMSSINGNSLVYRFVIRNKTDATPQSTRYDVELFMDLNGDGRYTSNEKQRDIVVRSSDGVQSQDGSGRFNLAADTVYTVTKTMPSGAVGLFDWCLRATKIDGSNTSVRTSLSGLTRIAPAENQKEPIRILQIASSDTADFSYKNNQQRVNFEFQQRILTNTTRINETISETDQSTNNANVANRYLRAKDRGPGVDRPYYEGIYGKLIADVDDFDIQIYTVYANEIDSVATLQTRINARPSNMRTMVGHYLSNPRKGESIATYNAANGNTTFNNGVTLYDVFWAFDMLIIGFDDSYGKLNAASSRAIAEYINGDPSRDRYPSPVLFAHDAITFFANTSASGVYGVESAVILKDPVAQDRYGLTTFPRANIPSGGLSYTQPIYEHGVTGINTATMLNNNYSVAWTPKAGRTTTMRDLHGFNSHILKWYRGTNTYPTFMDTTYPGGAATTSPTQLQRPEDYASGTAYNGSNNVLGRRTRMVTQLNDGKITTYPYNVNLYDLEDPFGSNRYAKANVGETHGQYFTVNMNYDDIAVWYCLSSAFYIHNDAANGFYIYNTGNVTYTGAGHSMTQGVTTGRNTAQNSANPQTGTNPANPGNPYSKGTATDNNQWRLSDGIEYEAKLFVNTMIAAYRVPPRSPEIEVTDSQGNKIIYQLLPTDDNGVINRDIDDMSVYFSFIDGNLNESAGIYLNLTWKIGDHWEEYPPGRLPEPDGADNSGTYPVTFAVGGTGNRNGSLLGGVPYKFAIPQGVLDLLGEVGPDGRPVNNAVTIRLEVVNTAVSTPGYKDVVIRRLELFPLS